MQQNFYVLQWLIFLIPDFATEIILRPGRKSHYDEQDIEKTFFQLQAC